MPLQTTSSQYRFSGPSSAKSISVDSVLSLWDVVSIVKHDGTKTDRTREKYCEKVSGRRKIQ
jgi:hypothetical protein